MPEKNAKTLADMLEARFDLDVEFSDPGPDEDVPVLLQNNAFAEPVESVVESYSMPGKGEIDPSFLVACFYYILFGIMLVAIATHRLQNSRVGRAWMAMREDEDVAEAMGIPL